MKFPIGGYLNFRPFSAFPPIRAIKIPLHVVESAFSGEILDDGFLALRNDTTQQHTKQGADQTFYIEFHFHFTGWVLLKKVVQDESMHFLCIWKTQER